MKNQNEAYKIAYVIYGAVVFGVLAGCIIYFVDVAFWDMKYFQHGLEEYSVGAILNLPVSQISTYILKRRGLQFLLFVLGIVLTSYGIATGTYSMLFGAFYGIIMCNLLLQYGLKGTVYGIICFFPHYLCYLLALYFGGKWFFYRKEVKNRYYGNVNKLQYLIHFFVIFFLLVFALVWEIKFQKNILNYFYQYLV